MKIKLTQDTILEDGLHKAGESVEVIAEIAKQLLATGGAEIPVISQPIPERVIEALEELPEREPIPAPKKARKHAS
jgi:hypothetical protein